MGARFQATVCKCSAPLGTRPAVLDTEQGQHARFLSGVGLARLIRIADALNLTHKRADIYQWHRAEEAA